MKLLTVNNKGEVDIQAEVLMIKEFKELWNKDKTKKKDKALRGLTFVYYMCNWESPYSKYLPEEREQKIIEDIFFEFPDWRPSKEVKAACLKYDKLQETYTLLLLQDAKLSVDELRKYFRNVDLEAEDKSGKKVFTAKDLISNLKAISDVVDNMKKLEDAVKAEQAEKFSVKGGGHIGLFEDPN